MRPGYNQRYWPATQPHSVDVLVQCQIPRDRFVHQQGQFMKAAITSFQHGLQDSIQVEIRYSLLKQKHCLESVSDWHDSCQYMMVHSRQLKLTKCILGCIVHTYYAILEGNSKVAVIHWRRAFSLIDDALKIGVPDILMTLLRSAVLLIRCGCSDVVALLQAHLQRLVCLRADQHRPFTRALSYFANSELRSLEWLEQCVVGMFSQAVRNTSVRCGNQNHHESVYWSQESAQGYLLENVHENSGLPRNVYWSLKSEQGYMLKNVHEKFSPPPSVAALVEVVGYLVLEMPEAEARSVISGSGSSLS
jgi:hypothetical protein